MTPMQRLDKIRAEFDKRVIAEKTILAATIVGVLVYAYLLMFFDPVREDIASAERQIDTLNARITAQITRAEQLQRDNLEDPDRTARERLEFLVAQQNDVQLQIEAMAGNLVSPNSMTSLLTTVLDGQPGLDLVRVENKVPRALRSSATGGVEVVDGVANPLAVQVYQHGIVLEFAGDYFSVLRYLLFLEGLSESFFWDSLTFRQTEWPRAYVILEIHTLSTYEGFIGV